MKDKTFLGYIKAHASDDSPIGDFCADSLRTIKTGEMPECIFKQKRSFLARMEYLGACAEAIEVAKEAWGNWKAERKYHAQT